MLLFPWLLTGVVIVEVMFRYQGFGQALVDAAGNNDIDLLLACSLVSVTLVLATQLISDIGYAYLNPAHSRAIERRSCSSSAPFEIVARALCQLLAGLG